MSAAPSVSEPFMPTSATPFSIVYVTLSKLEPIQLARDGPYRKTLHERAASQQLQQEANYKRFVLELQGHAVEWEESLRAEIAMAQRQG